jgi:sec-independent protein translocase protein TatA
MAPQLLDLGPSELVIMLVIALVLFGGSRLAGLGKSAGRAIREFKEETSGLAGDDAPASVKPAPPSASDLARPTSAPVADTPGATTNDPTNDSPSNTAGHTVDHTASHTASHTAG